MAVKSLAVKYRPDNWGDVAEQDAVKIILKQQLATESFQHAYLFAGGAGTGKTTCARIFANEINKGKGSPIEMDAASQNGVDDVREIIQQAKLKSIDSEYKVFILDEVHSFSNNAWQAMLKLIEEPPAKSIFIFATTNPEKIPKTILSRVQRYDFRRISQKGIVDRLVAILAKENTDYDAGVIMEDRAVEYIANIADGHMRDAISLLDKCLSYSTDLTMENAVKALGTIDYSTMLLLSNYMWDREPRKVMETIDDIYSAGKDLKQFLRDYIYFLLDVQKYACGCDFNLLQIPKVADTENWMNDMSEEETDYYLFMLKELIKLNADIKYSQYPKADIEAALLVLCIGDDGGAE